MRKRLTSILLTLAMLVGLLPALSPQAEAAADDATALLQEVSTKTSVPSGYTPIYDAEDLQNMQEDLTANYILMNDIDLSGINWKPMRPSRTGVYTSGFIGTLEGNGFTIRNLTVNAEQYDNGALFYQNEGTIQNLRVTGQINLTSKSGIVRFAASLAIYNKGTIYNCTSAAGITAGGDMPVRVGGLVSENKGTIDCCRYTGTIHASAGGGEVSVGGITYINDNSATISHCENVGIILAESGNSTEVKDTISSLVNESSIHLGGIAGKTDWHSTIDQCRATCTIRITGESHYEYWYIGGIVGSGFVATFSNCCFNGTLSINVDIKDVASGIYKVGGLAGDGGYESKYENCYVSGVITDSSPSLGGVPAWLASDAPGCEFTACYYPAGTLDPFVLNKPNEEKGYTAVPLASMASKATFPEYDFSSVWTMGQSYPIQKVFTHLSNGSSTPIAKPTEDTAVIDASEYIQQHVTFAQSNGYSQQMDQRMAKLLADAQNTTAANAGEAAYDILNTASELSKFKSLSIFDNPYDAMLTELILSATSSEVDSLNTRIEAENLKLANSIWDMILKVQPNYSAKESTYKPAIQELLSDPEHLKQRSPDIYEKLAAAIEQYRDDKGTRSALNFISGTTNFFGKVGDALDVLEDYQNTLDWIIGCSNYVSVVHAYEALNEEYIQTLHQVAGKMGNSAYATSFRSALQKYDDWLNCEVIAEALEFTTGFAKLTYDTLSPLTENVMTYYLSGCLGLDVTNVTVVIAAYNLGWSLSNALTGNDKMVESREIIRASYYVEDALYNILQTDREELKNKKDLSSAQKFDASYMLLRTSEMYALQAYKDYLDASEKSFTQGLLHLGNNNFNTTETTLANFAILRWDAAMCHGQAVRDQMMSELIIACPTDVYVENEDGETVLTIEDGVVTTCAAGVSAAVAGDTKVLGLTGGPYNITIWGTDRGTMDVSYTAYSSTGRVLKQQHYDNLPLTDGCLYESSIEPSSSTSVDFTLDGDAPENNFRFTDVPESAYFYEPVLWAVENGITSGTSATKFSPYEGCTRGQVVTFLWRAAGCPEPESSYNPFSDVPSNAYYHDAVLWAAEEGITTGTSRTRFEPNATVTRAQTVTFLWRWAGSPEPGSAGSFRDVPYRAYYADAVAWAVEYGITNGTAPGLFSPAQTCTRAQIVTFLYRDLAAEWEDYET
ncbi:S-layer homology domain-containing protein [Agathobaculum sp.]|uniref:S-layer homology domain-containing protein n=1 Tax=Agathobaculum sp. TaxID=2048138 RepID=UPI003AB263FB